MQVPRWSLALGVGALSQLVEWSDPEVEPFSLQAALRSAREECGQDGTQHDARSVTRVPRQELGLLPSRPTSEATVADAAGWFAENGYVKPERLRRMHLQTSS